MAKEYTPEWAKKLEDWGKGMEAKYGNGECCPSEAPKAGEPRWKRENHPVGDLFGQLISYLIITYVPPYFPGFFSESWSAVYTVAFFSIMVHVAVDLLLIVLKARPFYYLGKVITNIASVVVMVTMVTIFPFNFPGLLGNIVQFALWVVIVIVSIVTLFDFLKIFGTE